MTKRAARPPFRPDAEQLALVPDVSGNTLNGHGEREGRRPTPIYWHDAEILPHGKLMQWYQSRRRSAGNKAARERIGVLNQTPLAAIAEQRVAASPEAWTDRVKTQALSRQADSVGITHLRPEWVFEGYEADYTWMIILAIRMDYDMMRDAPSDDSSAEVMGQYERGTRAARSLAEWIRGQGFDALPHCGPRAGPVLLIPAAIETGIGELGKHGSMIHREFGASFRLATVLTDMPLAADAPSPFGADDFCLNCQVCVRECPVDAIHDTKQWVRGTEKWYVDFDKCVLYFNEHHGCAICLAVCPWSRPDIAPRLVEKMSRRAEDEKIRDAR